jgi:hypothetical protein
MEPLWSPAVATGGNRRQIDRAQKPRKLAKSVGVGCDRLPIGAMVRRGSVVELARCRTTYATVACGSSTCAACRGQDRRVCQATQLSFTADAYSLVLLDETELDYARLLAGA